MTLSLSTLFEVGGATDVLKPKCQSDHGQASVPIKVLVGRQSKKVHFNCF